MAKVDLHTKIAGVTYTNEDGTDRQELIEEVKESGVVALVLRREPHNPHDTNAVALLDAAGRQLGFLSRRVAEIVAPCMDRGMRVHAAISSITGDGLVQNHGVNIRVWSE